MTVPLLVLSGLDPTGGAGLTADVAMARSLGLHPLPVPTVLTVQNSLRFSGMRPVEPAYIRSAVESLAEEFRFDVAK
ncbi:MAG TPA: bifunctional hydroxymethylpyrimidine kinase/phosphomethylpyrimidine kinase, partial [bacterium]|nr:bifunctional hydroxymethylpyrimidine kinase/phosphomethylpyrimidine kinase [bacterium]